MIKFFCFCFLFIFINFSFSQKYQSFEGKLFYEVNYSDFVNPTKIQTSYMNVYTNDTIVRIETENVQLGKQILIKNLPLNKYYVLLEMNDKKYAIQHTVVTDTTSSKYIFKKKIGSKKFHSMKAKKMLVIHKNNKLENDIYYLKNINPIYLDVYKGIPGLPVEYYLTTEDGVFHYTLKEISQEKINKDLFGIPKEYKKISFDDFINEISNQ